MHPYMAFIDITKAFDLVSRRGLLKILKKIGCAPRLLNIIAPFTKTRTAKQDSKVQHQKHSLSAALLNRDVLIPTLKIWNLIITASPVCVQQLR